MPHQILKYVAFVVTYALFGALGYSLARKFKSPVAPGTWFVLMIGVIVLGFSWFGETWLIAIDGFHIYLVRALQAILIGMLVRVVVLEKKNKPTHITTP